MKVNLKSIHLTSGASIEPQDGITLIVGPNNAGKSALLSQILGSLQQDPRVAPTPGTVVASAELAWELPPHEALEDLKTRFPFRELGTATAWPGSHESMYELPDGNAVHMSVMQSIVSSQVSLGGQLIQHFAHHFVPEGRTEMVHPASAYNTLTEKPSQAMQRLYANRALEAELSQAVETAFGEPLTFNRYGGQTWSLHVGAPKAEEQKPPQTAVYLRELSELGQIQEQGHGMRSFVGIALTIMAGDHRLILLDEPEAFLHPPQARSLGRLLTKFTKQGVKIIIATHSNDLVQGVTEGASEAVGVSIHRITRDGNRNSIATIRTEAVKDLYTDPLMRFSSVLQGLFFHGVVLCEAEGDCTYYRAVLENLADVVPHVDIHFAHTNGKSRLSRAASSLRSAAVPVATVVDIDILNDAIEFNRLVSAHGGNASDFATRLKRVQTAVSQQGETLRKSDLAATIGAILDEEDTTMSDKGIKALRTAAQSRSGWSTFKRTGQTLLTGSTLDDFSSMLAELQTLGIFVVSSGELESFHPEKYTGDKGKWIRTVLEEKLYASGGSQDEFVGSIRGFIADRQADISPQGPNGTEPPPVDSAEVEQTSGSENRVLTDQGLLDH